MRIESANARRFRCSLFLRDRKGVAAIEFALVVPMLLVLYLGSADLCLGITMNRKVQHAASLMSDLVSRESDLKKADIDGIMDIGNAAVMPRASGLSKTAISGIRVDKDGNAKITWSRGRNVQPDAVGQSVTLPANLKTMRGKDIVRTLATYTYEPVGTFGFVDPFEMKQEVFAVPRVGDTMTCSNC